MLPEVKSGKTLINCLLTKKSAILLLVSRKILGIENQLPWTLDMVFDEDRQRKRKKNAAQNFSFIRKIALNILKKDKPKSSLVAKRLNAG